MDALQRVVISDSVSRWRPLTSDVPQGLVCLTLFDTFVGSMDTGIKCALTKFANDTELSSGVSTLEERDVVQRDVDRQACVNLMKLYKARFKVLQMDQCNPKYKYRLGGEWIESSPEEVLVSVGELEAQHNPAMCTRSPESQTLPGLLQKMHSQQGQGVILLFCCSVVRFHLEHCIHLWNPNRRMTWTYWSESRGVS